MNARTFDADQLGAALLDPSRFFKRPVDVVMAHSVSDADKIRILHRREYDVREEEVAQEENMAGELPVALSDVLDALQRLGAGPDHRHDAPAKQ